MSCDHCRFGSTPRHGCHVCNPLGMTNAKDDAVEAVADFERLIVRRVAQAIDDDLARQAKVQNGVWYEPADECGVAGAQMSIVPDELARAAIEAMRAAQPVEAVTRGMVEAGIEDASAKVGLILDAEDVSVIYLAMRAAQGGGHE